MRYSIKWMCALALGVMSGVGCTDDGGMGGEGGVGGSDQVLPSVTTLGAETVSETAERATGSIDPNGRETEYWFEWGTDESLTSPERTAVEMLSASSSEQAVSGELTGLAKATVVHYRLVARNVDGTVEGEVRAVHHFANVVFVTSSTATGNLGSWAEARDETGIAAGDGVCQTLADDAGLRGVFKAWLSDSNIAAKDRLARSAEAYVRVDGVRLADNWSDLTTAPYLDNPISIDEQGSSTVPSSVFTGTRVDGASGVGALGNNCLDWLSGDVVDLAAIGVTSESDFSWTEAGQNTCDASRGLYCFQQDLDLPQEPFNTECPGPLGWEWHVSRCSNGLYQDPDCAYVCCHFYDGTDNCNNIPSTFDGYTVSSCSYNTGLYTMSVGHDGEDFTVTCEVQ